jgi:hypothetical protein
MVWLGVALLVLAGPADAPAPAGTEPPPAPAPAPAPADASAVPQAAGAAAPPVTVDLRDPFIEWTPPQASASPTYASNRVAGDLRDPFADTAITVTPVFSPSSDLRDPFDAPPVPSKPCSSRDGVPVQRPAGMPCPGRQDPLLRDPFA